MNQIQSILPWLKKKRQALFAPKKPEPSYPRLPQVNDQKETTLKGVYAVGEVSGTPLVKLGLNEGHDLVMRLASELQNSKSQEDVYDLVIVGAGSSGLGAAAAAKKMGLSAVVLEANHLAETIYTMTRGKWIFAEPEDAPLKSEIWFEECTRETLLEKWTAQVQELGLDIRTFEKVEHIRRKGGVLEVSSNKGNYLGKKVILAMGKSGNPRKAGVPGEVEYAARIDHRLINPEQFQNKNLFIYGGGDVALEAALALCQTNKVTLATIDPEFIYPKRRNIEAVLAARSQGKIALHFNAHLKGIEEKTVVFRDSEGTDHRIANDHIFEMIGAEPPLAFFKKVGVRMEQSWTPGRWSMLALSFFFVYSLYALKSYGKGLTAWPYEGLIPKDTFYPALTSVFKLAFSPFAWLFTEEANRDILANYDFQKGYLYSGLYTLVMIVFGGIAMFRWRGIARNKRYQTWRYISLLSFQLGFFLIVNVVAVQALTVQYAWRAWGLYQPFPLFFNTFFWWYESDPAHILWFFVGAGLLGTLVIIPLLARNHGKRFCTWICGCGGLAETLGDRWRHLSAKGSRSREWEFQSALILMASFMIAAIVIGMFKSDGNNIWWRSYNYLVDFWLVAVIPITLYPFFGGKVWCRYWCPLAAWNQVLARWYGRLKIVSNDKCISCTNCSKFCQVGVDVMAFAKNGEAFDNRNSSCIQCGICIDVCPMDVLSFQKGEKPKSISV